MGPVLVFRLRKGYAGVKVNEYSFGERHLALRQALIKYCFESDHLQAVRKAEQMSPALASEAHGVDVIRVFLALSVCALAKRQVPFVTVKTRPSLSFDAHKRHGHIGKSQF